MFITNDIKYIGVNDHNIDLFEGQYIVPNGMAYNSYAIVDEKIAIMDSVDVNFGGEWLENIETALEGRKPDYLVVQHMEPDHSANIANFINAYPEAKIVSSAQAFKMMKNFFGTDFQDKQVVVGEGSTLSLGTHELTFITAPMVHWPEVIVTYDKTDKVLFSADGFGKFGALDVEEDWACEARRYYIGIVGKYGAQVQALLKKASALDIEIICPLHGPVLNDNLGYYIGLYDTWSSYRPEEEGVVIAYTSVYGNTKKAALKLAELLEAKGCPKVAVNDLARCDMAEAVEDAFRYSKLVLATTTYNADIFPFMRQFIDHLTERNYRNRTVAFIENGSWAPM
ncbi:MAG: FprA family A-type flavoprotein, partial [Clostridia bacterium]|nr:FprA family A-type flavoprotein [Clostridia bacterium]